jgi:hypothetical protein
MPRDIITRLINCKIDLLITPSESQVNITFPVVASVFLEKILAGLADSKKSSKVLYSAMNLDLKFSNSYASNDWLSSLMAVAVEL